jgi:alpha-D-xyloside xylohydrolase
VADQYMYGPDLLVAPVVQPGATSRDVYLPSGATWTDLVSGKVLDGGRWVTVEAPIETIPVLSRDGRRIELHGRIGS